MPAPLTRMRFPMIGLDPRAPRIRPKRAARWANAMRAMRPACDAERDSANADRLVGLCARPA